MDPAALLYLGILACFSVAFGIIVVRTYDRRRKGTMEEPKHRMLDDDHSEES